VKRMNSSYRREELSRGKKSFPAEEGEYWSNERPMTWKRPGIS
jgi:hypothetical protein